MSRADQPPEPAEFRLTGRHVLAILVGCFGIVFAVNGYMLYRAVSSFPGTVTESSYRDSQHFNDEIAAARAQAARGWKVSATAVRDADGRAVLRVEARDATGAPIQGLAFKATLQHPANRALDRHVAMAAVAGGSGLFEGAATDVAPGKWDLVLEGDGAEGREFLSHNTLVLR
ncbi:nitrogen fixation protein FixH [Siculibacillus lacustris]|uniref:Nitrogen fixation protein FixH n=1 Tax=Siculibacillus lacustris TaxID=1549641 RepID=A0A4Q9VNG0_9HYPH|nr:FixH family protein [Siculibacillus lacustris]TBW37181.1 nitrogen fixation protein FixH [Siculibacillus lacustris]